MADLSYSIGIDGAQAQRTLDALKTSIIGVGTAIAGLSSAQQIVGIASRFEDLRVTLGVLYKDTQAGADAFNTIKKFAGESVFSVNDLTESWIKLKSSGLEPTQRQLTLFADVSSVAADSVGALRAITDLYARTTAGGLGLEDLNRLADRGIPVFNILAETMGIGRLEIEKYGKTAEGAKAILATLETELERQFGGASQARMNTLGQSINQVSDAFQNLIDRMSQAGPGQELASSLKTIADAINNINVEQIGKVIQNIKDLVLAAGGLFIFVKGMTAVIETFQLLNRAAATGNIFTGIINSTRSATGIFAGVSNAIGVLITAFGNLTRGTLSLGGAFTILVGALLPIGRLLGALYIGFQVLDSAIVLLTGRDIAGWWNTLTENMNRWLTATFPAISSALEKLREYFGMGPSGQGSDQAEQERRLKNMDALRASEKKLSDQEKKSSEQRILDTSLYSRGLDELKGKYRETGIEQLKQLDLQRSLIGLSEQQRFVREQLDQADRNYLEGIKPYLQEYDKLNKQALGASKEMLPIISAKQEEVKKKIQEVTTDYAKFKQNIEESAEATIRATVSDRLRMQGLKTSIEEIINLQQEMNDGVSQMADDARLAANSFYDQLASLKQTNEFAEQRAALERSIALMRPEEQDSLRKILELEQQRAQILRQIELNPNLSEKTRQDLIDKNNKLYNESRQAVEDRMRADRQAQDSFVTGWRTAFTRWRNNVETNAKAAERIFDRAISGLEDVFVNFAKTGKFQWKQFVADMGEQLLRSNLQQLFAAIFGPMNDAMGSGQGFMGALGSLLGIGGGGKGMSPSNPLYVVDATRGGMSSGGGGGGAGGGFWDSIKSIGSSIWDGVKSVGSAIGDIFSGGFGTGGGFGNLDFGGFFANGGTLGAGRWGIAGERGPELISGPASITPLQPMQVTYNINAVDALSFKQMIAQDPSFIHAVAQQGSRGMARR